MEKTFTGRKLHGFFSFFKKGNPLTIKVREQSKIKKSRRWYGGIGK